MKLLKHDGSSGHLMILKLDAAGQARTAQWMKLVAICTFVLGRLFRNMITYWHQTRVVQACIIVIRELAYLYANQQLR